LGISDSIFKQLKKKVIYDSKKLFSFNENESRMIEENVMGNLIDVKSFIKTGFLVNKIVQA
jgi:hypothetical protein